LLYSNKGNDLKHQALKRAIKIAYDEIHLGRYQEAMDVLQEAL